MKKYTHFAVGLTPAAYGVTVAVEWTPSESGARITLLRADDRKVWRRCVFPDAKVIPPTNSVTAGAYFDDLVWDLLTHMTPQAGSRVPVRRALTAYRFADLSWYPAAGVDSQIKAVLAA